MMENEYMQQVQMEAQNVQQELKCKRVAPIESVDKSLYDDGAAGAALPTGAGSLSGAHGARRGSGSVFAPAVRITGWLFWKTVIVPPNMYVIHTKRGESTPRHIGLGLSFRFNPYTDSFLVVPSAMQTILIQANSICKELQGILIQAYVQWIIDDVETAYKRLDFSDIEDPMRIVNVQLREQAEAAIKDKVATMSITEVLSDKQPIIKELTKRLKEVAEGSGDDKGLGIRIVTVQIKEAVVSSTTLWQNLQKPYRAEQEKIARLAEIEQNAIVTERELADRKSRETREMETENDLSTLRLEQEAQRFDRETAEGLRRHSVEQEKEQKRIATEASTERVRQETEEAAREQSLALEHKLRQFEREQAFDELKHKVELDTETYALQEADLKALLSFELAKREHDSTILRKEGTEENALQEILLHGELERAKERHAVENEQRQYELDFAEREQSIANILSAELVQLKAVEALPEIARALPTPDRVETIAIGDKNEATLGGIVATLRALLSRAGIGKETSVVNEPE